MVTSTEEEQALELYEQLTNTSSMINCVTQKHPHDPESIPLTTAISTLPSQKLSRLANSANNFIALASLLDRLSLRIFLLQYAGLKRINEHLFWLRQELFDRITSFLSNIMNILLWLLISSDNKLKASLLFMPDIGQYKCHPLQPLYAKSIYIDYPQDVINQMIALSLPPLPQFMIYYLPILIPYWIWFWTSFAFQSFFESVLFSQTKQYLLIFFTVIIICMILRSGIRIVKFAKVYYLSPSQDRPIRKISKIAGIGKYWEDIKDLFKEIFYLLIQGKDIGPIKK